jgi:hypothetical protein
MVIGKFIMSKPSYICLTCGEDFTRKTSAERHKANPNIHSDSNCNIVRFIEYVTGMAKGTYQEPSMLPPRLSSIRSKKKNKFFEGNIGEDSKVSTFPDPSKNYIDGLHPRNQSAKEENNKKGQEEKTTGEVDLVDIAYQIFKKWKNKNDKFEEMRSYFANYNSRIPFSPHFPLDIFNYGKLKNTLPHHVRSEFCSIPMPSSLSAPQADEVQPKKVIGYVGVICNNCLESESLKVMYDPSTDNKIFRTQHICDPQNIDSVKGYPQPKQESLLISKLLGLSEQVTKTVKEWTQGGEVFLIPYKIDSGNVTKNTITLNVCRNQYNWLIRAILQKHTVLNDEELNEFFFLTYNATFCHFRINFVEKEEQQMMKQEFYFLFLNYKPCLPFEN